MHHVYDGVEFPQGPELRYRIKSTLASDNIRSRLYGTDTELWQTPYAQPVCTSPLTITPFLTKIQPIRRFCKDRLMTIVRRAQHTAHVVKMGHLERVSMT